MSMKKVNVQVWFDDETISEEGLLHLTVNAILPMYGGLLVGYEMSEVEDADESEIADFATEEPLPAG